MNLRHRYAVITIRALLGLFLVFSGVAGFKAGQSMEGLPADMVAPTQMLWDTGLFQMIKVTEIAAGLMLVAGFLPALAAIFIAPIGIGIIVFNAVVSPANLPIGIILCLLTAYLGYAYWDKYKALFQRK